MTRIGLVGASMGGTASPIVAADEGRDVGAVVTLSAPTAFEGLDANADVLSRITAAKLFIAGLEDHHGPDHRHQDQDRRRFERERMVGEQGGANARHRADPGRLGILREKVGPSRESPHTTSNRQQDLDSTGAPIFRPAGPSIPAAVNGTGSSRGTFSSMTTNRKRTMIAPA